MITITPRTPLNLFIVHETMLRRRTIEIGRDGVKGIAVLRELDADHLTRSVGLYNRVKNAKGELENVPVWLSLDTLPRWMTHATRQTAIAQRRAELELIKQSGGLA